MVDYAKVSELTEASNVAATDLLEISQDQGDTTFLSKKITIANALDAKYLKLDTSNGPVTGNLSVNSGGSGITILSAEPVDPNAVSNGCIWCNSLGSVCIKSNGRVLEL